MNLIDLTGKTFKNLKVLYRGEDLITNEKRHRVLQNCWR